jgi:cytochrome P450
MQNYVFLFFWPSVAYVIYSFVVRIIRQRRYALKAASLGCKPPPAPRNSLPWGIERIVRAMKADRVQQFPEFMTARCEKEGHTHQYSLFGTRGFMTNDPKNIQALLATQFHDFEIGPMRRGNFFPLLGNGIFTSDGKAWEHARAMMRPSFARDQVSDLRLEEEHLQHMMLALPTDSMGWTSEVDLQVLFFRLTLDSACEFLFGQSVGSQLSNLPGNFSQGSGNPVLDEKVFATAFDVGQKHLATRARFQNLHWLWNTAEFRKSCADCHAFVDHIVQLALSKHQKTDEKKEIAGKEKYVFLDALIAETRDPIELRSQLFNVLLAGRDTTASLLGWLFYELARDPEHFNQLRTVILDSFGSYKNPEEITFSGLKNCQYLQYCLNETLRIHAVVPFNSRAAIRDTTLPRGGGPDGMSPIFIRKGEQVDYSVHIMHRRKDIWGPDAEDFKPERWMGRKQGPEYLPFNAGPRICLGRKSSALSLVLASTPSHASFLSKYTNIPIEQLALTEAGYVTVRLMQRFDVIENRDPDPVVRHNLTLTSCSGTGVKVRLHEAPE